MQFPKSSLNPSVKIVAIAKDEAPYIAEWVYHHLWFGFNSIHVYVNRSSDSTLDILGKIHEKFPNVTYESADWVDWVGVEEGGLNDQVQHVTHQVPCCHELLLSPPYC